MTKFITVDNIKVPVEGERNLLEVIRKANVDLPTFCYHSELSIYGSCRMCLVEIEGRGIQPACSTPPDDGLVVHTNTKQIRDLRKIVVELTLADHEENCTTCPKSWDCRLRKVASSLGIEKNRFRKVNEIKPVDYSSPAVVRNPNKCILCGGCTRICEEVQGVGILEFANRGTKSNVIAGFDKPMGEVECVNCGQCIKACPVGALSPKYQINEVWDAVLDKSKTVVVQIAPAVRVAIGEYFDYAPGETTTGQMVTALRMMGFDKVYDTSFGADLTVVEEGKEFLKRYKEGRNLPQFTSCCPAWVKFAEQYYPDMLDNLSTCKSPQQMFGSICKDQLTKILGIDRKDLVVVSIMPCTAKKFEAQRPEFSVDGNPDVDYVITTNELAKMIKGQGIDFRHLEPSSFDVPFGFKTGAGVIFGTSGGVSEAVLRYAASVLGANANPEVTHVKGGDGINITETELGDIKLRLATVSGLASARKVLEMVKNGEEHFDLIEVMACCGGCINGGGQPASYINDRVKAERTAGLYKNGKQQLLSSSEQNPYVNKLYSEDLSDEHKAHELFHTGYGSRRRMKADSLVLNEAENKKVEISICFGTSCLVHGAEALYDRICKYLEGNDIVAKTEVKAHFCTERCTRGPVVIVNGEVIEHATYELVTAAIEKALA